MAKSKFLPYQDRNNDGLIDACKDIPLAESPKVCPSCKPNPNAFTPNWRKRTLFEPFLNGKLCKYQITVKTEETTTGTTNDNDAETVLESIFDGYKDTAIDALLDVYNKEKSQTAIDALRSSMEHTEWFLDYRPRSRLKLLYSISDGILDALEDASIEIPDEDEETEQDLSDIVVHYKAHELDPMLMTVRKGLRLYGHYAKVAQKQDMTSIIFKEDDRIFDIQDYGDRGFSRDSIMSQVLPQLETFLNGKGYKIPYVSGVGNSTGRKKKVGALEFTFTSEYILKKLLVYTDECPNDPVQFINTDAHPTEILENDLEIKTSPAITVSGPLTGLLTHSAWKDPTAMAYFAALKHMVVDLTARVPMDWVDYVVKYTYPEVIEEQNYGYDESMGCLADALANEAKQLGEDILDEAFSITDAIVYKFRERLCEFDEDEIEEKKVKLGIVPDFNSASGSTDIGDFAKAQAHDELTADDQPFMSFCGFLFGQPGPKATIKSNLDDLGLFQTRTSEGFGGPKRDDNSDGDEIDQIFDRLKFCGLIDLLTNAIQCLFGGLTLEEGLASISKSALDAMSIDYFGDLFVGLPIEKQEEIDALVKEKLENGEFFQDDSANQLVADDQVGNYSQTIRPWEAESGTSQARTLATSYDSPPGGLSDDIVMEAYAAAIIEVFEDEYLDLVDEINKFPGGQLIANTIATMTCPQTPPPFDPSVLEFVKDFELPFCRSMKDMTFPKFVNPAGWIPEITDINRILFNAVKEALNEMIVTILMKLLVKICETIGSSICQALETTADISAALAMGQETALADMLASSICGDEADEGTVNDTLVQTFGSLGLGAAAFADQEKTISFAEAVSSSTTRRELAEAFLGNASSDFLDIVDTIIEYEFPEYRQPLPNQAAIARFFNNMGNLTPLDFRGGLNDFLNELPANEMMPANPTLCATPEDIDNFCSGRSALLEGRASPSQIQEMCSRAPFLDDLGDLANALQDPIGELPPMLSDPGCDNGMFPYEPESSAQAVGAALGGQLESLKVAYGSDMLGNGPAEDDWGFMNMILSDTKGQPVTTHHRKVANRRRYVDFNILPTEEDEEPDGSWGIASMVTNAISKVVSEDPGIKFQKAAYPVQVAEWMQSEMINLAGSIEYSSNNSFLKNYAITKSFKELDISTYWWSDFDLLELPETAYNTKIKVDLEDQEIKFVKKARKAVPDYTLHYEDNSKGMKSGDGMTDEAAGKYSYAFDLNFYLADLVTDASGSHNKANALGMPSDTTRIEIIESFDPTVVPILDTNMWDVLAFANPLTAFVKLAAHIRERKENQEETKMGVFDETQYEFLTVDDTFLGMDLDEYTNFLGCFQSLEPSKRPPQVVLLTEMLKDAGADMSQATVQDFYDPLMQQFTRDIMEEVANNEAAFKYGAAPETLTDQDIEYGLVGDGETYYTSDLTLVPAGDWIDYSGVYVKRTEEELSAMENLGEEYISFYEALSGVDIAYRKLKNQDYILGISYMQYQIEYQDRAEQNRIFYLSPGAHGGTYKRPPIYVAPQKQEGWLAFAEAAFPELSQCKPATTDFVDFGQIQDLINDIYPNMPEDERLKNDPNCVVELPYNRILHRSSAAALEGLIIAAIRIYTSAHLIKSIATFSKFSPRFPHVYSSIYAAYIVEVMEESFKDAQGSFLERFNVFKDEEFWYAFLEQSVQMYARRVDEDKVRPPPSVLEALMRLNGMQESFEEDYPERDNQIGLAPKDARESNDAGWLQSLKSYRADKVLEAIRETQEDAKLILKELVIHEMEYMGKKFVKNLKKVNIVPDVHDMDYYLLEKYTQGSSLVMNENTNANGDVIQEYLDLPTVPIEEDVNYEFHEEGDAAYFTAGSELVVSEAHLGLNEAGDDYVGYYHVYISDDSEVNYMAGERHLDGPHDVLIPVNNQTRVMVGDVADLGSVSTSTDGSQPFVIEKYVSVAGTKMSVADGTNEVSSNDGNLNISDVYPGPAANPLELIYDAEGEAVGLTGELGVRLGLLFSMVVNGTKYEITSVEIDALDLPIGSFRGLPGYSKELLCLISHLKQDDKFRLISQYVFPLRKIVATNAIYNDMAFVPSIGEKTVAHGADWVATWLGDLEDGDEGKAGAYAQVEFSEDGETPIGMEVSDVNNGWASYHKRAKGDPVGVLEFDDWDGILFKNSKSIIKRIFKSHYYSRDFNIPEIGGRTGPGQMNIKRLKGQMFPSPGKKLLPWWKRRRLRPNNPFDIDGKVCENED